MATLATNSLDRSVRLYDVATGISLGTPITIANDESNSMTLSLDGKRLAVGGEPASGQHAIQIWDLEPDPPEDDDEAPPVVQMTLDFGPVALSGRPASAADGTGVGYAPRRYVFDPMLADAAVAAGAELREGVSFAAPIERDGRIGGIRTTTPR